MIATRPDWCISRQRAWGVPILVFYCEACNHPLTDRSVLDPVVELIRQHTADIWYSKTAEELLGPGFKCAQCGGSAFRKENDILDVWFDSGASHLAVLTDENRLSWPSDMYLEGGDQYRGWFHSSLLVGVGLKNGAPYRASATNGWTLDGEGHALSKSKGAEEVEIIVKKYGAELLRLWTASVDFTEDVRFSETIVARLVEAYRKLRNTLKYALGNLHDFDPARDAVPMDEMLDIDRWVLSRAEDVIRRCRAWYDELEFHKVYRAVYDFAVTDLSALYFDVLKDRLYTAATFSRARRSGQTALYRIHYALVRLIAPLLAFTAEEAWSYTAKPPGAPESVHLAMLPEPEEVASGLDAAKLGEWNSLMEVRTPVLKALEAARQEGRIGASLEARVRLAPSDLLERYAADLPSLFIVSQVRLDAPDGVIVERADGSKCERCWKYSTAVGEDSDFPTVCEFCSAALKEML
jgi:isoleucyl-tRNA synthetase